MTDFPRASIFSKAFLRPWWAIFSHIFIHWSSLSFSQKAMHQTNLLSLCLTLLINRWPAWESGLRPCHSPARLIGFHLSQQSRGSDYKQINKGVGQVVLAHRHALPLWQQRRLRVCESGQARKKSTVWRPACLLLCCGKDDEGSGNHDWIIDFLKKYNLKKKKKKVKSGKDWIRSSVWIYLYGCFEPHHFF